MQPNDKIEQQNATIANLVLEVAAERQRADMHEQQAKSYAAAVQAEQQRYETLAQELAAAHVQAGMIGVTADELSCVINWLEGGRDPKDAAKELRIYRERGYKAAQPVQQPAPVAADLAAFNAYFCNTLSCDDSESEQLVEHCRVAAYDAWCEATRRADARAAIAAPVAAPVASMVLPGCLADRLYEAISIALERAQHAGNPPRMRKWVATRNDLRAALAAPVAAPVAGQEPYGWDCNGALVKTALTMESYKRDGVNPVPLFAAPVPAASVHDLEMQQYIGTRLRRVATAAGVTVDYGDDEFYYAGAFSILGDIARALDKTASSVQPVPTEWRELAKQCLTSMKHAVHYGKTGHGRPPQQTCLFEIEALEKMLAAPDSGRDAALVQIDKIADKLEDAAQAYEGDFADDVRGCIEDLRDLAAHPANVAQPVSDAALAALKKLQRCMEIGTGCMPATDDQVVMQFEAGWSGCDYTELTFGDLRNLATLPCYPPLLFFAQRRAGGELSDAQIIELWDSLWSYHGHEPCKIGHIEFARVILSAAKKGPTT